MNKLYVLVRGDLTKSQQAVQSCHAVAEFMRWSNKIPCKCGRCNDLYWENNTIVLLKVKNLEALQDWYLKISVMKFPHEIFYEPDISEETALAAYDLDGKLSELLKDLPLL